MTPGSPWSNPDTVAGFVQSPPNDTLVQFAARECQRGASRALDIGCGAARNAVPLAELSWTVLGLDLSEPMLRAARERARAAGLDHRVRLAISDMDHLPVADASIDLVIAHGIWNLARSAAQFRRALDEAARAAKPGAGLFVFTFSRNTLSAQAAPVAAGSVASASISKTGRVPRRRSRVKLCGMFTTNCTRPRVRRS